MPALPLDAAGPYVAGAYLVFLALVLIYVSIMAGRLARIDRELDEVSALVERRDAAAAEGRPAREGEDLTREERERVA